MRNWLVVCLAMFVVVAILGCEHGDRRDYSPRERCRHSERHAESRDYRAINGNEAVALHEENEEVDEPEGSGGIDWTGVVEQGVDIGMSLDGNNGSGCVQCSGGWGCGGPYVSDQYFSDNPYVLGRGGNGPNYWDWYNRGNRGGFFSGGNNGGYQGGSQQWGGGNIGERNGYAGGGYQSVPPQQPRYGGGLSGIVRHLTQPHQQPIGGGGSGIHIGGGSHSSGGRHGRH